MLIEFLKDSRATVAKMLRDQTTPCPIYADFFELRVHCLRRDHQRKEPGIVFRNPEVFLPASDGNLAGLPHLMHALALQSKQIMGLRQKAEVSVIKGTFRVDDGAPFFCTTKTYLP